MHEKTNMSLVIHTRSYRIRWAEGQQDTNVMANTPGPGTGGVDGLGCMGCGPEADGGGLLAKNGKCSLAQGENRQGGHQLGMVSTHPEWACPTSERLS